MNSIGPLARFGHDFLEPPYLPEGKDEYYLRYEQNGGPAGWRHLTPKEVEVLEAGRNRAADWNEVLVHDPFDPSLVRDTSFFGLVRIGALQPETLRFHDLEVPEGIAESTIIASDIGDHAAIYRCSYLSHYLVGDRVILHDIGELQCTNHAKFGTGIVKEGEDPSVRISIAVMNEKGGRAVYPFDGMTTGDAWLWAKHRDDGPLMEKLAAFTDRTMDRRRGWYGRIGNDAVIKGTRIIKDVWIGPSCYIKGANKLKNLRINSSEEEPTQLGEGIELVNGIIGLGCRVFYGCKAVRFILEDHCTLKYGARVLNSIIGDNSTISCCEVLSNLIFPAHEQHHNTSFLIASCIKGQSNMAAGANIGSNHNTRGADGELVAGRGFWPALSSTLKHNCAFASFLLITKGNYPDELSIPLPFSLLSCDRKKDQRVVMPAYWWRYNLYALERNSWKFRDRDRRRHPRQYYETDYLAPDTVEEILAALPLLETWIDQAWKREHCHGVLTQPALRRMLEEGGLDDLAVEATGLEHSDTPLAVIRIAEGYRAYRDMLWYFGVQSVSALLSATGETVLSLDKRTPRAMERWENLGGQLITESEYRTLRNDIVQGAVTSWDEVHAMCRAFLARYPETKAQYGLQVLRKLTGHERLTQEDWFQAVSRLYDLRSYIETQVLLTRRKDYENPFRMITYRTPRERDAVLGTVNDDPFIRQTKADTARIRAQADAVRFA